MTLKHNIVDLQFSIRLTPTNPAQEARWKQAQEEAGKRGERLRSPLMSLQHCFDLASKALVMAVLCGKGDLWQTIHELTEYRVTIMDMQLLNHKAWFEALQKDSGMAVAQISTEEYENPSPMTYRHKDSDSGSDE